MVMLVVVRDVDAGAGGRLCASGELRAADEDREGATKAFQRRDSLFGALSQAWLAVVSISRRSRWRVCVVCVVWGARGWKQ